MDDKAKIEELIARVNSLEGRLASVGNVRFDILRRTKSYLVSSGLQGDYCEFGIGYGRTFTYAVQTFAKAYPDMRFWAFDTFTGMPAASGLDAEVPWDMGHHEGEYAISVDQFQDEIKNRLPKIDFNKIEIRAGLFNETLPKISRDELPQIMVAFVDPIYYESTVPVLDFLTYRIQIGSVIIFDDWYAMRNLPQYGNQRACNEWTEKTGIKLSPLFSYGGTGQSFSVLSC